VGEFKYTACTPFVVRGISLIDICAGNCTVLLVEMDSASFEHDAACINLRWFIVFTVDFY